MKLKLSFNFIARKGKRLDTGTGYKTRQRDQILNYLIKNKDHNITADEIIVVSSQERKGRLQEEFDKR